MTFAQPRTGIYVYSSACLLLALGFPRETGAQDSPPSIQWERTFGPGSVQGDSAIHQTHDGGYVLGISRHTNAYLIKADGDGNLVWEMPLGKDVVVTSLQVTADGGFVAAGSIAVPASGGLDLFLAKGDAEGNPLWQGVFGGANDQSALSVQETSDGGLVVVGLISSQDAVYHALYLVKTDQQGELLWQRPLEGLESQCGLTMLQTTDGGFIAGGTSIRSGHNRHCLTKLDQVGTIVWETSYEEEGALISVRQTSDGGYIATGAAVVAPNSNRNWDLYLLRTNGDGRLLWKKTFGGEREEIGNAVQQTTDGGFIAAGHTNSFGAGYWDFYIVRTSANGDLLWEQTWGTAGEDEARSLRQTADGGYVLAGVVNAGARDQTARIVKLGPEGATRAVFLRGDSNGDERANISDALHLLTWLFLESSAPTCSDSADADDQGKLDLSDAIYLLNFLYLGGPQLPAPGTEACGPDPTQDDLSCSSYPPCSG